MTHITVKIANTEQVESLTSALYQPDPCSTLKGQLFRSGRRFPDGSLKSFKGIKLILTPVVCASVCSPIRNKTTYLQTGVLTVFFLLFFFLTLIVYIINKNPKT